MYGCHVQTGDFFVGFIPTCFTVEFTSTADLETVRNSLELFTSTADLETVRNSLELFLRAEKLQSKKKKRI
jgi:hypothetical protein